MTEHQTVPLGQEFKTGGSDRADPDFVNNLQRSANLANENCDRAVALAHKLSAQLREAENRINQLERESERVAERLLAEAKAAVEEIQSTTKREGDERIARLMAEAESRFQTELARVTHGLDQIKAEADARIQQIKSKAEARVTAAETGANKRIDMISSKNEDQIVRLEADLADATQRADRAEQWLMLIRREIEDHLMPSFTAIHNLMRPEGTDRGDERGDKSLLQAQP
jgi:chromosome segregation ATPase